MLDTPEKPVGGDGDGGGTGAAASSLDLATAAVAAATAAKVQSRRVAWAQFVGPRDMAMLPAAMAAPMWLSRSAWLVRRLF